MRERVQGISQGATGVGQDALNTVGGGVKGVVDTAGNTVRTCLLSFRVSRSTLLADRRRLSQEPVRL